ncbi:hypothetical protein SAMD00079811_48190 [Scytonema sp. HK-05]|uniref:hypothetical protein n=1 Tax=Scytonema sp. HK-05 TaxID=1137095 RepID=UPI000935BB22|nr:hypothetical protein [Scytonema sp. HK-05]OKH55383.1 hypothetical protein NIES2130_26510 [Scytonema sp. HK-05]BAY47202.1 hypothetical protein SAMD00079811_48190 [Scytonema sp. HK-05]
MNKCVPLQVKFNALSFVKFSLVSLALSLSFGAYTQANAQSVPKGEVEVISVPPQEAYFIEKPQETSPVNNSDSHNGKTFGDTTTLARVSNSTQKIQGLGNIVNSVPSSRNSSSHSKSYTNVSKP